MPSVEIIQALLFIIGFYTNHDPAITHELNQVIVNGQVNPNALSNLEDLIIQRQMLDVLQIMRQTLRGKMMTNCLDKLVTSPRTKYTYFKL